MKKIQNAEYVGIESSDDVSMTPVSQSNDVYVDYVQGTSDTLGRVEAISCLVSQNMEVVNKVVDLASQVTDVYAESQRLTAAVEIERERSKVELAKTAAKFMLTKQIIEEKFSERRQALSAHYTVLEKAIESNDKDLIINAMHQISSIVVTSPLADIQDFIRAFEDKSQPLLDF